MGRTGWGHAVCGLARIGPAAPHLLTGRFPVPELATPTFAGLLCGITLVGFRILPVRPSASYLGGLAGRDGAVALLRCLRCE